MVKKKCQDVIVGLTDQSLLARILQPHFVQVLIIPEEQKLYF